VHIYDEFSPLTHVIVGTTEGMVVPGWTDYYADLDPGVQRVVREFGGRPAADVPGYGPTLARIGEELDAVAAAYSQHGIKVDRIAPIDPRLLDVFRAGPQPGGYSVFPADPMWVIGHDVIECRMREPARARELFPLRAHLAPLLGPDNTYLACPITNPVAAEGEPDYYLEGGDIVIDGPRRRVFVGIDERRSSSAAGVAWLAKNLERDGWTTIGVPVSGSGPIHLLGSICFVGESTIFAYEEGLTHGLPDELKDMDIIPLTREEALNGATCVVMLDPQTALISGGLGRVEEELHRRGITTVVVDIPETLKWDGGIRCVTFLVNRESNG
jgi:N-dimethylarginine dimethylaminohydrolase